MTVAIAMKTDHRPDSARSVADTSRGQPRLNLDAAERDAVAPSVRAILDTLQDGRPRTGADIRAVSGLPRRTVYAALRTLRERGLLMQRASLHDTRQTYFWLARDDGKRPAPRSGVDASTSLTARAPAL